MDRRSEIIVTVVCVVTLVLFGLSIFLMSTVDPPKLKIPSVDIDDDYPEATVNVSSTSNTPSSDLNVTLESTSPTSPDPGSLRKGRRSIIDRVESRHLSGVVILQVLDEEKQPRVEIVLRSKSRDKIKNEENNYKIKSSGPTNKSNAAVRVVIDLNQNDLLQIVSDDIVVVENILDSISKEDRGGYNMEVLQYSTTDDIYLKNEKLVATGPENDIYTPISEKMYDVGKPTEPYVYPASAPFTQHDAYFRRNLVHEKTSFVEHNVTSINKEGTAEVRLPVNETVYKNNTSNIRNHSSKSVTEHATNLRTNIVHETNYFVLVEDNSNNKKDTVEVRLPVTETVFINNTLNVHNCSSKSVTMDNTTEKGDLVYTVMVPSLTSEIVNMGGSLYEDNSVNKTRNTEYTVVIHNQATESVVMQNTMNLSSDTVTTEDTTSKENLDTESFIAEDIFELSNPTSSIFISENPYLEDDLIELNPAIETVKTEHIVNISNDTSKLVVQEETLNNSSLATENIDKEDPMNIEYTLNKSIPDKVIANMENTKDNRDPANEIVSEKHTS